MKRSAACFLSEQSQSIAPTGITGEAKSTLDGDQQQQQQQQEGDATPCQVS
jgi:hypothetical protein